VLPPLRPATTAADGPRSGERPASRKEKSLGILCQRFVQMFLRAGDTVVGLDDAAAKLRSIGTSPGDFDDAVDGGDGQESAKSIKAKNRRLYDIANILTSLNLIEKVQSHTRKPAFRWTGGPVALAPNTEATPMSQQSSLKRSLSPEAAAPDRGPAAAKRRKALQAPDPAPHVTDMPRAAALHPDFLDPSKLDEIYAAAKQIPGPYGKVWQEWIKHAQRAYLAGPTGGPSSITPTAPRGHQQSQDDESNLATPVPRKSSPRDQDAHSPDELAFATPTTREYVRHLLDLSIPQISCSNELVQPATVSAAILSETKRSGHTDEAAPGPDVQARITDPSSSTNKGQLVSNPQTLGEHGAQAPSSDPYKWTSPEHIEQYMRQARHAGPEYAKRAEQWLEQVRQWQSIWGPWASAISNTNAAPNELATCRFPQTGAVRSEAVPPPSSEFQRSHSDS
jgi:hypothetical protein